MLVTIGIPAYKRVESFEKALRSAVSQSYKDLEIIVSKDHSADTAVDRIAMKYAADDNRIKFILQNISLRTVGNFSFLKDHAAGKYFLWLADDDWIDENYVEACVNFLEAEPAYSLACGICVYHDGDGRIIHNNSSVSIEQENYWARMLTYYRRVTLNGYFYGVYRTELVKAFPLPDELAFDWSLVAYLCFKGKVKTISATASHIVKGGMSNEGSDLNSYFAKKTVLSNHLVGLSSAVNCAGNIFHSGVYTISWIKKLALSFLVFVAAYSNTIRWDLLFIKRKLVRSLGIDPKGVIRKRN